MTHHALATFLLLLAATTPVNANTSPVEELRTRVDRAVQVLNDPATQGPEKVQERRTRVRKIADEIFDYAEMAKRSLGPHWTRMQAGDRERFIRLYSDLLDRAYFEKIDSYEGEKVRYLEPRIEGDQATVATRVVTPRGTDIPVDYRMHRSGDRWMVHDVLVEGVSLVANYRSQFDRIIRTSSTADLLKRMEAQVAGQASPSGAEKPKARGAGRE